MQEAENFQWAPRRLGEKNVSDTLADYGEYCSILDE